MMKTWKKRTLLGLWGVLVILLAGACWYLYKAVPIGTGYAAKYVCSSVFVSERDGKTVFEEDVAPVNILAKVIDTTVDRENKSVTATGLGLIHSKAIYREGCGCTLVAGTTEEALREQSVPKITVTPLPENLPWPTGRQGPVNPLPEGVDGEKIERALDRAFSEPGPGKMKQTRAVVVVYDGRLIAERYAPGFHKDMPLLGWSMSKSVINALIGILVGDGILDVHAPAPVPEWRGPDDPRGGITIDQLLRMSSGLQFEEIYEPLDDVTEMLYGSADFGAYAAAKALEAPPGTAWHYSSGTTNILSGIIRRSVKGSLEHYLNFVHEALFDKLGMQSVVAEPDPSGTYVGSSYTFATPRDWARFGLLYLQDGVWQGERILPERWVTYSTTPAQHAPLGQYGAHFWLNAGSPEDPTDRMWPRLPQDAFAARGFQGQRVVIIPSKKLVVVRMGLTVNEEAYLDIESLVGDVLAALPGEQG
jgi:CubicO group peptidase (beta-lactamase class C family)